MGYAVVALSPISKDRGPFRKERTNRHKKGFTVLKGFKEFITRGNIVDLAVAVAIGAAFTGLVTKFTDSIITPLISRVGAGKESSYGLLRIDIGGGQTIDLNVLLSAFINFLIVAAAIYFVVVVPYNKFRSKGNETPEESAADKQTRLLTEIRDSLGGRDTPEPLRK